MRRRSAISLTPLIDVVFILLVFFMLASSFMNWRVLELGIARPGGDGVTGAMLVELRQDGLRLSGVEIAEDRLIQNLSARFAEDPAQRILVKPGQGVPLQRAVDLIERIGAAGGRDVSFVTAAGGT